MTSYLCRLTRRASLDDLEQQTCELAPKVENRIIIINKPEVRTNRIYVLIIKF